MGSNYIHDTRLGYLPLVAHSAFGVTEDSTWWCCLVVTWGVPGVWQVGGTAGGWIRFGGYRSRSCARWLRNGGGFTRLGGKEGETSVCRVDSRFRITFDQGKSVHNEDDQGNQCCFCVAPCHPSSSSCSLTCREREDGERHGLKRGA